MTEFVYIGWAKGHNGGSLALDHIARVDEATIHTKDGKQYTAPDSFREEHFGPAIPAHPGYTLIAYFEDSESPNGVWRNTCDIVAWRGVCLDHTLRPWCTTMRRPTSVLNLDTVHVETAYLFPFLKKRDATCPAEPTPTDPMVAFARVVTGAVLPSGMMLWLWRLYLGEVFTWVKSLLG
jgi:hypothetical protein